MQAMRTILTFIRNAATAECCCPQAIPETIKSTVQANGWPVDAEVLVPPRLEVSWTGR